MHNFFLLCLYIYIVFAADCDRSRAKDPTPLKSNNNFITTAAPLPVKEHESSNLDINQDNNKELIDSWPANNAENTYPEHQEYPIPYQSNDDLDYFGPPLVAPFSRCNDGVRQPLEQCDLALPDGNNGNQNGCNIACGKPFCGNGITEKGEQCDDGNDDNGDGCSSSCLFERCGNCILDPHEQCDDGNLNAGDCCSPCCTFEPSPCTPPTSGTSCNATTNVKANLVLDDGQSIMLFAEKDFKYEGDVIFPVLPYAPTDIGDDNIYDSHDMPMLWPAPFAICGNCTVEPTEQCDDCNLDNQDGCNVICLLPICGNGMLELDEECDDNNNKSGDGCSADCRYERCGNLITERERGEQCDDGNKIAGDGCSPCCQFENIAK